VRRGGGRRQRPVRRFATDLRTGSRRRACRHSGRLVPACPLDRASWGRSRPAGLVRPAGPVRHQPHAAGDEDAGGEGVGEVGEEEGDFEGLGEGDLEASDDREGEGDGELERAGDDAGWVGDGT